MCRVYHVSTYWRRVVGVQLPELHWQKLKCHQSAASTLDELVSLSASFLIFTNFICFQNSFLCFWTFVINMEADRALKLTHRFMMIVTVRLHKGSRTKTLPDTGRMNLRFSDISKVFILQTAGPDWRGSEYVTAIWHIYFIVWNILYFYIIFILESWCI